MQVLNGLARLELLLMKDDLLADGRAEKVIYLVSLSVYGGLPNQTRRKREREGRELETTACAALSWQDPRVL